MVININNKQYTLKLTLRALILFEKVAGTSFKFDTLSDQILYLYCLILANNEDVDISLDDLIEAMDNDPTILLKYFEFLTKENTRNAQLKEDSTVDESKKV